MDKETKELIKEIEDEDNNLNMDDELGGGINNDLIDDDEREIDVASSKLSSKVFSIQSIISHFEYRLRGFIWKANGDKYVYCGNPLAGKKTIQNIILLLDPFSKTVNMIGDKKDYTWQKQLLRTRLELASILTNAYDSDLKNFKVIWRTFSNLMFNLGDVILGKNSRSMLEGIFGIGEKNLDGAGIKKELDGGFYG